MNPIEKKAVQLVAAGNVIVDLYKTDTDGAIETAAGHVHSGNATYWTTIDPAGGTCSCTFGLTKPGRSHSHDLALRLAAQLEATEEL